MAFRFPESQWNRRTDKYPLLMEQPNRRNESEHVIDIRRSVEASSSSSPRDRISNELDLTNQHEERPSSSTRASHLSLPLASISSSRNSSSSRRGNGHGRRRRSPLNSGIWVSVELVLALGQIIASVIVLSLSRHEHPHTPLFAWVVGYTLGCVATLPLLYWRYLHRNQGSEQDPAQSRQSSSNGNTAVGRSFSRSVTQIPEDDSQTTPSSNRIASVQSAWLRNARLKAFVEYFKMGLDCFFAVWFVVGNVWIFGGHASPSEAPNLYRLCIVFLVFSCIGYAMPFILCATICCCLPCIISVLGFREDLNQTRGATSESINALPTYKFKLKKGRNTDGVGEAGVVAAGTEKERVISGEDAVCCICLAKYANKDELRELPCSHLFHKECVDKWLKINALCPLCKSEVGDTLLSSLAGATASLRGGSVAA